MDEKELKWCHFKYAVWRNFGGLEGIDPIEVFKKNFENVLVLSEKSTENTERSGPFECKIISLIRQYLATKSSAKAEQLTDYSYAKSESRIAFPRYLLLITKDERSICTLKEKLFSDFKDIEFIFGSTLLKGFLLLYLSAFSHNSTMMETLHK